MKIYILPALIYAAIVLIHWGSKSQISPVDDAQESWKTSAIEASGVGGGAPGPEQQASKHNLKRQESLLLSR